jgi:FkbM family methyltransferase
MKYLFDIGANNGSQWLNELSNNQNDIHVYMFEPTSYLCSIIKDKYKNLKNWNLIENAVSNFNGKSVFNIAGQWDWGCSSLLNFKNNIKETWPKDRTADNGDLHFTESIEVDVIELNSFLDKNPHIDKIDHLHIDTQGSDLNVLKGCSNYLHIIMNGNLECGDTAPLYDGSPTKNECMDWLKQNGFKIDYIKNEGHNECDIYFSKV